jgi:hypothetical protein
VADAAIFIGWGAGVRGRERTSITVFDDAVQMWTRLESEGTLESWDAVFLEPHGGDLAGFFLLRGEREALARLRIDDDFQRLILRASLIVESLGVVGADVGEGIRAAMGLYQEAIEELT